MTQKEDVAGRVLPDVLHERYSRFLALPAFQRLEWDAVGILVSLVTNFVVIPLSKIGMRPVGPLYGVALGLAILMVIVGLPIGLATRRFAG